MEPSTGQTEDQEDEKTTAKERDEDSATSAELVEKLGNDYADYLSIDTSAERKKYSENVDEMLTKLDEFCGLVDMIRSDTALCLYRTMPEIQEKCKEMQIIFGKIDKLEALVTAIRRNVADVEDCVNKAETEMGSLSGIKKMLSSISIPSFMSPKKSASKQKVDSRGDKGLRYDAPEIFDTDRFFSAGSLTPPVVLATPEGTSPREGGPT